MLFKSNLLPNHIHIKTDTPKRALYILLALASLTINENCDPDVRKDMEMSLNNLAPEDAGYIHTDEGSDDMVGAATLVVMISGLMN
ncbi:hypothetical protein RTP6_006501 [Batrachochytrium dendrobatidis]